MQVIALDLSLTSTGYARTTELRWECGTIKPRTKGVPRLQEILDKVSRLSKPADLVVLEGYSYASRHHAHQLGELGGVLRLFLHQAKKPFVVLAPKTAKKLATGKGNAGKELMLVEAVKRLGYLGADNNEADALWLLQAALQHYQLPGAVSLPQTHLEALDKLTWPKGLEAAA